MIQLEISLHFTLYLSRLFFLHMESIQSISDDFSLFFHSQHGSLFNSIFSMITSVSLLSLWNQIIEWLVTSSFCTTTIRRYELTQKSLILIRNFLLDFSMLQYFNHHFFVRWVLLHWKYHQYPIFTFLRNRSFPPKNSRLANYEKECGNFNAYFFHQVRHFSTVNLIFWLIFFSSLKLIHTIERVSRR